MYENILQWEYLILGGWDSKPTRTVFAIPPQCAWQGNRQGYLAPQQQANQKKHVSNCSACTWPGRSAAALAMASVQSARFEYASAPFFLFPASIQKPMTPLSQDHRLKSNSWHSDFHLALIAGQQKRYSAHPPWTNGTQAAEEDAEPYPGSCLAAYTWNLDPVGPVTHPLLSI